MHRNHPLARLSATAAAFCVAGLAACGSGSDDSSNPAPTPTALTLIGTASNGTALASRPVAARCAAGTGSATTGPDGGYSLALEGGALPCLLETTTVDGQALHSVAAGTGSSATAHLTPFTELVVARLAGSNTSTYYASFGSTTAAAVTADSVAAAVTQAIPVIASAGVDTAALGNVLTSTVQVAPLTAFDATLAATGLTLAQLSSATAQNSPNNPLPDAVPSLSAELLLKPKAATCSALRSATYRVADPHYKTADEPEQTYLATFDATTLAVVDLRDNSTDTLVPNGTCRFTNAAGDIDAVVSQAGVMVLRYLEEGTPNHRVAIAFPEQAHTLAELAGTWNGAGFNRESGDSAANVRYDFNPVAAAVITTDGVVTSPDDTDSIRINANATGGGFDLVNATTGELNRLFALRTGGGNLMLVVFSDEGAFEFLTPQRILSLPTAGNVSGSWAVAMNTSALSLGAISESSFTILSVDADAKRWTRVDNATGVQNTFLADNPALGFNFRPAATSPTNTGGTVNVLELTGLRLLGAGLNVSWVPLGGSSSPPGTLNISVTKP